MESRGGRKTQKEEKGRRDRKRRRENKGREVLSENIESQRTLKESFIFDPLLLSPGYK